MIRTVLGLLLLLSAGGALDNGSELTLVVFQFISGSLLLWWAFKRPGKKFAEYLDES